jgi:hypothetical protein
MKTISADYNAMTESGRLRLGFSASQEDLRTAGAQPGDWVWLSDDEVIVGARILDDPRYGVVGEPDWKTLVHLDDEQASDPGKLLSRINELLDACHKHRTSCAEDEAELFRLLTIFEHISSPEIKAVIPPGYLALRRAAALHFLGESGLALHEAKAALQDRPHDPDLRYLYLELRLRDDPASAAREAEIEAEKADASAQVLAACVDVWAAAAEQMPDDQFDPVGHQILHWAERFESARGREQVRAAVLASVQFNRGLVLLRLGQVDQAQETLRLAHATDPNEPAFGEASQLDTFDDRARKILARLREKPLPWPAAAWSG